jgi:hypothetical protein
MRRRLPAAGADQGGREPYRESVADILVTPRARFWFFAAWTVFSGLMSTMMTLMLWSDLHGVQLM